MITKERLEELIEKGNMIWDKNILPINLMNFEQKYNDGFYAHKTYIKNNQLIYEVVGDYSFTNTYSFEDLFETREDAEEYAKEYAEFGNITRTERLELPSWEDVKDVGYDEIFFVKDNRFDSGVVQYYFLVAEQSKDIQIMFREIDHIMTITAYDVIFKKPLTRENYNEARRLCVKLFKGEE